MPLNYTNTSKNYENLKNLWEASPSILFSPSEIYHENSNFHPSNKKLYQWIQKINSSNIAAAISRSSRRYDGYPLVKLSEDFPPSSFKFEEVIKNRQTVYAMSGDEVQLETLSKILYIANGISHSTKDGFYMPTRTTPSGGALYPIELYCVAMRVNNLESGIYFFDVINHSLIQLQCGDFTRRLIGIIPGLEQTIRNASFCIAMVAVMPRVKFKYGERGYRFALLEAGHIGQNTLLAAVSERLVGVPVGGFFDDQFNTMLGLDGLEEIVVYSILVGDALRSDE